MKKFTLPKAFILKKDDDFRDVINDGKPLQGECFTVFVRKCNSLRFGFAVNSKVKSKPKRNRLKRRTREAVRLLFRNYNLSADIVFIAREAMERAAHEKVMKEVGEFLKRAEKMAENN